MSSNRFGIKFSLILCGFALSSCETIAITIVSPGQDSTLRLDSTSIIFELSGASGNVSYACKLDGQPFSCNPTAVGGPFPPPIRDRKIMFVGGLRPGPHTVVISATDSTGNTGSASVRFVMDELMNLTMTSPDLGQWLTTPSTTLAFATTGQNGPVSFNCQLDRNR
jgi:hypothetical protein